MHVSNLTSSPEPKAAYGPPAVVLAEIKPRGLYEYRGHVIEDANTKRFQAALPLDLVNNQTLTAILPVWAFGDGRGPGCPQCCGQGDVGKYQRRDTDPYIRLYPCPHCYKPI